MSKRTNKIFAVTIARFAGVYVEAETPEEAMTIVKDNLDAIYDDQMSELDDQFEDSNIEVHSCDAYPEEAEDYMEHIYADGETLTYEEYMRNLKSKSDGSKDIRQRHERAFSGDDISERNEAVLYDILSYNLVGREELVHQQLQGNEGQNKVPQNLQYQVPRFV